MDRIIRPIDWWKSYHKPTKTQAKKKEKVEIKNEPQLIPITDSGISGLLVKPIMYSARF